MRLAILGGLLLAAIHTTQAQLPAVVAGEGYEAFPRVQYQGGHSAFPRAAWGVLVLRDSTISFHECGDGLHCTSAAMSRELFKEPARFTVRLRDLRELSAQTRTRSPGVGRRIMFGALANDRNDELLAFAFDGESTAEAPVFKTLPTQAGAIEAKMRFRLRRLGVELPATP